VTGGTPPFFFDLQFHQQSWSKNWDHGWTKQGRACGSDSCLLLNKHHALAGFCIQLQNTTSALYASNSNRTWGSRWRFTIGILPRIAPARPTVSSLQQKQFTCRHTILAVEMHRMSVFHGSQNIPTRNQNETCASVQSRDPQCS